MFCVIYAFRIFVIWQKGQVVNVGSILLCIACLVGAYFARGGVVEFIGIVLCLFLIARFYKKRQYAFLISFIIIAGAIMLNIWDLIFEAFEKKVDDYGDVVLLANNLKLIQMHSPIELYKLPFQYFFSIITPFTINIFSIFENFTWLGFLCLFNIAMYPIAFGSLFYLFMKKHNALFYFSTFLVYIVITSMVLAIFRHYFFLFFLHVISFVCFMDRSNKPAKSAVWLCSAVLFSFVLVLSMMNL